ncbi:protein of unknown function [Paraburkholderia kururiensis]
MGVRRVKMTGWLTPQLPQCTRRSAGASGRLDTILRFAAVPKASCMPCESMPCLPTIFF